jgi:trehalose-6-phosphatase
MFAAAPREAITVRVGPGRTRARFRLAGPDQVRTLLAELARRRAGQDDINAGERDEAELVEVGAGLP